MKSFRCFPAVSLLKAAKPVKQIKGMGFLWQAQLLVFFADPTGQTLFPLTTQLCIKTNYHV